LRLGAYAGFGLGAAALITGTVFLIQRKGLADDADREYQSCAGANSGSCTDPNWQRFIDELDQDASNKKTLAIVSMSASALFVAAGVVLYVTSEPDDASAARIVPYLTPLGGGLRGRF
jgi:hypothetical protein